MRAAPVWGSLGVMSPDPFEPTTPDPDRPVRTQADLEQLWRSLVEPLGFAGGALWVLGIGADDLPTRVLMEIRDEGFEPTPDEASSFGAFLAHLAPDVPVGTRWAFLRCRPGHGGPRAADRELVAALVAGCRAAGVATDVAHLATDDTLVPLPYDELARSA
jgi:hypothetical protein